MYRCGDKIVCIHTYTNVTYGKIYEIVRESFNAPFIYIIDDTNQETIQLKRDFISLEEYRNKIIDELLNIDK